MKAPVKKRHLKRLFGRSGCAADFCRRLEEVLQRLTHAKVHQANAHVGGKQHGGPGKEIEFRLRIVRAEPDIAKAAGRYQQQKHQKYRDRTGVKPVKVAHYPSLCARKHQVGALRKHGAKHQKPAQHQQGGYYHLWRQGCKRLRRRGSRFRGWSARGLRRGRRFGVGVLHAGISCDGLNDWPGCLSPACRIRKMILNRAF